MGDAGKQLFILNFEFWIADDKAPLSRIHCLLLYRTIGETLRTLFFDTDFTGYTENTLSRLAAWAYAIFNFEFLVLNEMLTKLRFLRYIIYYGIELLEKTLRTFFLTPQLNTQRVAPGETRTKKVSLGRRFNGAPMAGCPLRYHRRV